MSPTEIQEAGGFVVGERVSTYVIFRRRVANPWSRLMWELGPDTRTMAWLDKENRRTDYMRVDSIRERALAAGRGEWLR